MNRAVIVVMMLVAWSVGMFGAGWAWRGDRAEGAEARQEASSSAAVVEQVNQTRTIEHSQADTMAAIGAKHEEDRAAAPAVADAVVADLRSGALRLRNDLAACHTDRLSQAAAGAGQRDAAADLGVTLAGPVVRIGRDADDQLRACQALVAADRGVAVAGEDEPWNMRVEPEHRALSTGYPQNTERAGTLTTSVATGGDSDPGN